MLRRIGLILAWAVALVGLAFAGAFGFAQTATGKRLISDQIGRALSDAGTTVRLAGLDGLIPVDFRLQRLRVADSEGPWVIFAGHSDVHLPHSVQAYAPIKLFQVRSFTSFAPNLPGSTELLAGASPNPSMDLTSLVTTGMFSTLPFGSSRAKYVFGNAMKMWRCFE
jgi:hypothetical protein